jgi:hypothetical protein
MEEHQQSNHAVGRKGVGRKGGMRMVPTIIGNTTETYLMKNFHAHD